MNRIVTEHQLRWWFGRLNRIHFSGKLPRPEQIRFFRSDLLLGECEFTENGNRLNEIVEIRINERLRFSSMLCIPTLLHEMAHANVPSAKTDSDPKFIREISRLMRAGAFNGFL